MTADFITATRTFYDAIAYDYADRFRTEFTDRPAEKAMLGVLAELVGTGGEVAERRFVQGSMLELEVADGALDGLPCRYSSIHAPDDRLPLLFRGFERVPKPGGHLLPAFQMGDVARRPERMAGLPRDAGFDLRSTTVREPDEALGETSPQAFLPAARRPGAEPVAG
ncbi:SAM-dependent methyltransferase [Streptomyces sp. NPDC008092]|uniref:SAM-dependent methyltransferase n=1 Tax=Streptomyces sp. NPDC008092 TaxID=3364808 RepID=UPI0036E6A790